MNPAPPPSSNQALPSGPSPPPQGAVAASSPPHDVLTMLAIGVAVITGLYIGRDIILPVVLAVILAFVLTPIVNFLRRLRLRRAPAVIVTVILALAFLGTLTVVITSQVGQLAADLPRYEATIQSKVAGIQQGVLGRLSQMAGKLGRQIQRATDTERTEPEPVAEETMRPLPVEVHAPDLTPLQVAQRFILPALHPLATFAITFVVLIFILLQREDLRDRVIRLFGSRDLHRTTIAMDEAAFRLSRFFLTQVALSAAYGVIATLFLWLIGVPSPILCGVLAAAMRFVPYVGSIIAAAFPMVLAFAVDPGWSTLMLTAAFFLLGEPAMGYVVEPLVYGQSTGLSPFAVILSTIFWSWLWGPVGLILAMPLTLCLVVLGRHVETFQFLDVILGDSPPLEPPQNFYQRMLAADPDEALEQAETLLKDRSLARYYDEVALRGLILAARDAGRGVLTSQNLQTIRNGVAELTQDLADAPDVELVERTTAANGVFEIGHQELSDEWRADGAIMCVAGRGPLDEAVATLLADILRKHGFGASVTPHAMVSRGRPRNLKAEHVKLACVCCLELEGAPAHLRYLLRRLRQSLPGISVAVGLWPENDAIHSDDALRTHVGADHYVCSLRQALQVCLREAADPALPPTDSRAASAIQPRPLHLP